MDRRWRARLTPLLDLSGALDAPITVAVVPNGLTQSMSNLLRATPHAAIWQHGLRHTNESRDPA
jgi:hypothetical protein